MQLDYKGKISRGPAKLEDYYTHLIRLFSERNAHEQVIAVAKLALAELSNVSRLRNITRSIGRSKFFSYTKKSATNYALFSILN